MTPVLLKGYISCICMVRKNEGHMPKMLFLGGFTLALTKDLSLLCSTSHRGHFGFVGLSPPCDRKPHERKGHVCFLTILRRLTHSISLSLIIPPFQPRDSLKYAQLTLKHRFELCWVLLYVGIFFQ